MNGDITIIGAFVGGLAAFFAPCTFAMLPTFLTYLASRSAGQHEQEEQGFWHHPWMNRVIGSIFFLLAFLLAWGLATDVLQEADPLFEQHFLLILIDALLILLGLAFWLNRTPQQRRVFLSTLAYVAGFLLVFIFLQLAVGFIGDSFQQNNDVYQRISGIIVLFFGLFMLLGERFPALNFLYRERKVEINPDAFPDGYTFPFVLGLTSAFAWTSCVAPIFTSILFLGTVGGETAEGSFYLIIFGLGTTLPFLILALFLDYLRPWVRMLNQYTRVIYQFTGVLFVILGISLILDQYSEFIGWLENRF